MTKDSIFAVLMLAAVLAVSSPGRADFILTWPVDICTASGFIDLKMYPNLDKWYARCHERPAWKRSLEKGNGYSLKYDPSKV